MISLEIHKEIHSKLMQRKNPTLLWGSPFDNAWVGFVLHDHKIRDEVNLSEILNYFDRLLLSVPSISDILKEERNIGAISLYAGFLSDLKNKKQAEEILASVKKRIIELNKKEKGKFGLFSSPEIFYSTVAGLAMSEVLREEDLRRILLKYVLQEAENNWFNKIYRFALYSAALFELKAEGDITDKIINFLASVNIKELGIDEIVSLLWFLVKYHENILQSADATLQRLIEDRKEKLWEQFENQSIYFSYDAQTLSEDIEMEGGTVYSLSTFELAMIDDFLACLEKTYKIDPNRVFNLLDLHPVIKKASEKLFKDGHYAQAIFDAYKALINYVKEKSGQKTLDGQDLMGLVFDVKYDKKTLEVMKKPILQLNELRTREDMDEQKGFMYLFVGSVLGIRNPKAHAIVEQKDPFKTLEYLSFASLLAKRIDEAKLNQ